MSPPCVQALRTSNSKLGQLIRQPLGSLRMCGVSRPLALNWSERSCQISRPPCDQRPAFPFVLGGHATKISPSCIVSTLTPQFARDRPSLSAERKVEVLRAGVKTQSTHEAVFCDCDIRFQPLPIDSKLSQDLGTLLEGLCASIRNGVETV
jgi:hypothetical protein